jgi:hypothetical protein
MTPSLVPLRDLVRPRGDDLVPGAEVTVSVKATEVCVHGL